MTVQELEDLLARLPADMPVLVEGAHIERIFKENSGIRPRVVERRACDLGRCYQNVYEEVETPAFLNLYSGGMHHQHVITDAAPPVVLKGRWPRGAYRRGAA